MADERGPEHESWLEWRRHLLAELERQAKAIEATNIKIDTYMSSDISKMKVDIAMLQVKSGMWGAVAGIVVVLGTLLLGKLH